MVKKLRKIIILMIIAQFIIFIPTANALSWDEIIQQGDKFINDGKLNQFELNEDGTPVPILNQELLQQKIEPVYNILLALGVAISVGAGAVMGIKFMAGSVEEQAKIKEMLIPYIIGCIVVFGGFGIWKIVMNLAGDIFV